MSFFPYIVLGIYSLISSDLNAFRVFVLFSLYVKGIAYYQKLQYRERHKKMLSVILTKIKENEKWKW